MRLRAHARRRRNHRRWSHRWWPALAAAGAAATGVTAAAPVALAQGFGLNEIGSCAIARGFAVTSAPCDDASSLYWNPGAVSNLPMGVSAYVGGTAIGIKGKFTTDYTGRQYNSNVPTAFPPYVGLAVRTSPRLMLGIGAYVPYGLTSEWNNDFPGRFSAQKSALQNFYIQPTAAYELVPGRLSVGAGAILALSSIEIRQSLDFSQSPVPGAGVEGSGIPAGTTFGNLGVQPYTEFARARVNASGHGGGFTLGIHAHPVPSVSIGARYLSRVRIEYRNADVKFSTVAAADSVVFAANNPLGVPAGTSLQQVVAGQFASGGALAPGQSANTVITNPAQFQVGVAYTGLSNTTLSADFAQIQWSSFKTLPFNFTFAGGMPNTALSRLQLEDYKNSNSYRFGLEHRFPDAGGVAGRLGFAYSQAAAPDVTVTPLLPDMDRYNFGGGIGVPLSSLLGPGGRRYAVDLTYFRVETRGRRGRTGERPSEALTADQVNNGFYNLNANVVSASVRATF
ncbi:long-chain fatty acid transporter [Gemmatimonadetes bacterium T265]|nr:long-chain fatty acid transporter [Gemmatimonadetes bacterium T265]